MNIGIEKEYKKLLTKEQFNQLSKQLHPITFHRQRNTYYDTKDGKIRAMRGAMRIREINDTFIFTLKMWVNEDLYEYECEVKENSTSVFTNPDIQTLLEKYGVNGEIIQLTTLDTLRGEYHSEDAVICLDYSQYNGKEDYEIEYEYKKEHDGLQVFQQLLDYIHVQYTTNCESKIKRALDSLC